MTRFLDRATVFFRLPRMAGLAVALGCGAIASPARADDSTTIGASSSSSSASSTSSPSSSSSSQRQNLSDFFRNRTSGSSKSGSTPASLHDAARKKTVVTRAKTAAKGRTTGGGIALPDVKLPQGLQENAVYLSPGQWQALAGDRFSTTLSFYNVKSVPADRLDLWLHYDPDFLDPTWVDLKPIEENAATSVTTQAWRKQGYLRIRATLREPLAQVVNPLCVVHWRALAATLLTRVDVDAPAGEAAAIMNGAKNLIATTNMGNRSRVGAIVVIDDHDQDSDPFKMADETLDRLTPVNLDEAERARLIVEPAAPVVDEGAIGTADVVLVNPERRPVDRLRFCIRYDPDVVKIMDADQNNYITDGINLFDGDFHARFPFDFHRANAVDPDQGLIVYDMGMMGGAKRLGSGVVARIVFRMARANGEAGFVFERSKPLTGEVVTDVSDGGISLLGEDDATACQALHDGHVTARPAGQAFAPASTSHAQAR
jgi:hypothetical protein